MLSFIHLHDIFTCKHWEVLFSLYRYKCHAYAYYFFSFSQIAQIVPRIQNAWLTMTPPWQCTVPGNVGWRMEDRILASILAGESATVGRLGHFSTVQCTLNVCRVAVSDDGIVHYQGKATPLFGWQGKIMSLVLLFGWLYLAEGWKSIFKPTQQPGPGTLGHNSHSTSLHWPRQHKM